MASRAKRKRKDRPRKRPGVPNGFHGRLRQALGKDLQATGRFRKVIEEEIAKCGDPRAVGTSVTAFIEKLRMSPKFTQKIENRLLSAVGQAAHEGGPSTDEIRLVIRKQLAEGKDPAKLTEITKDIILGKTAELGAPSAAAEQSQLNLKLLITEEVIRKELLEFSDDPKVAEEVRSLAERGIEAGYSPQEMGRYVRKINDSKIWVREMRERIRAEFGKIEVPFDVPRPSETWRSSENREGAAKDGLQHVEDILEGMEDDEREEFLGKILAQIRQDVEAGRPVQPINLRKVAGLGPSAGAGFILSGADAIAPQRKRTPQEQTIENYMAAMTTIFTVTRTQTEPERKRMAIYLWQALRDARVFHFETDTYQVFHQDADRFTTELADLTYKPVTPNSKRVPKEEGDRLRKVVLKECARASYPDKFPFPSVFLGYGAGVGVNPIFLKVKAPKALRDKILQGAILGHLMTEDGSVVSVIQATLRDDVGLTNVMWFDELRVNTGGGWVRSEFNLEPWILPALINVINDHRTFILEAVMPSGQRKEYKRKRKEMGLKNGRRGYTPPPYYTLRMKTKLITEKVRKGFSRPTPPRSYRTDVRAHERCRIARGTLPLDPERGAKFNKRGYKVFTVNPLDADTLRRLSERGQPYKRADEWLAILTTWVEPHMSSNDESLPYIPACRLPGHVRGRKRQPTNSWADDPGR